MTIWWPAFMARDCCHTIMLRFFRSEVYGAKRVDRKRRNQQRDAEDLEENEASVTDTSDDTDMPSPDGAFDESDELKDADPM